ncbi:hypothetical protein ABMA27_006098 [Loxostege sticticalis]|uniref:CCHC-type domain-containing protein n=1 Tax=Loxostege sticticalis TaxID=481309 RepID=A0ABR3HHL3_LOXSC
MSVKSEVSEKITLSVLTKFIKTYNGDRESLPAFLTNCDNAMSLATPDQQNVLCKFIISQLEGKAQVVCSLKTFSTWDEIKKFLKSTFGEKKHSTHLLVDLQNCKQSINEDVTNYSLRIEQILTRIQSDIHNSCKDSKELLGRIAAMEDLALNTFLLGLNSNISTIVRCRNPSTLNEAVQHALQEEKLFNLTKSSTPKSPKQCSVCNKFGHISSNCYFNKKPNRSNSQTHNSFHLNSNSKPNPNNHNNFNRISCNYCKNLGHTIDQCRKRQYNMARRENNNSAQRDQQIPRPSTSNVKHCTITESQDDDNLN